MDCVNRILPAKLSVIVDFHPSDLHPDYIAQALTAGLEPRCTRPICGCLSVPPDCSIDSIGKVALELMNEPPRRPHVWQPMLEAAYAAARRGSANLLLVLEGGQEASAAALLAMRTTAFAKDRAVLFSFHYYDPYQFTHQGASWNDARYLADVPYPALARSAADSLEATAAAIGETNLAEDQKSRRTAMRRNGWKAIVARDSTATRSPRASSKSPIGRARKAWRRIGSCSVNSAPGRPNCNFPVPGPPSGRNGSTTCASRQKRKASAGPSGPIRAAAASASRAVRQATTSSPVSPKRSG